MFGEEGRGKSEKEDWVRALRSGQTVSSSRNFFLFLIAGTIGTLENDEYFFECEHIVYWEEGGGLYCGSRSLFVYALEVYIILCVVILLEIEIKNNKYKERKLRT